MVGGRGLEPLHHCWRQDLNLVRLPISPSSLKGAIIDTAYFPASLHETTCNLSWIRLVYEVAFLLQPAILLQARCAVRIFYRRQRRHGDLKADWIFFPLLFEAQKPTLFSHHLPHGCQSLRKLPCCLAPAASTFTS